MQTFKQKMRGGREENVMLILYVELGTQSVIFFHIEAP